MATVLFISLCFLSFCCVHVVGRDILSCHTSEEGTLDCTSNKLEIFTGSLMSTPKIENNIFSQINDPIQIKDVHFLPNSKLFLMNSDINICHQYIPPQFILIINGIDCETKIDKTESPDLHVQHINTVSGLYTTKTELSKTHPSAVTTHNNTGLTYDDKESYNLRFRTVGLGVSSFILLTILLFICIRLGKTHCKKHKTQLQYHQDSVTFLRVPSILSNASSENEFCAVEMEKRKRQ